MFCPQCGKNNKEEAKFCIRCGAVFDDARLEIPPPSDVMELEPGTILDNRYRIIDIIEKGGMGAVYKAEDGRLDIVCAVKEMRENFERDEYRIYAIEKFKSEALILSKLRHPNIPRVSDYFIENKRYYMVMDYIEGQTLYKIMNNRPSLRVEEDELIKWTLQLCSVLSYLHNQDPPIIYRDIKPANIMLNKEERIMLIDFGIARIFKPRSRGTMIGTQGYSPPEQYRGQADPRSDIYALGATLHHLITGKDPQLDAPFSFAPVKQERPEISDKTAYLIDRCLKFNMEERFSSVEEIREFIEGRLPAVSGLVEKIEKAKTGTSSEAKKSELAKNEKEGRKKKGSGGLTHELENLLFSVQPKSQTEIKEKTLNKKDSPLVKPAVHVKPTMPLVSMYDIKKVINEVEKKKSVEKILEEKKPFRQESISIESMLGGEHNLESLDLEITSQFRPTQIFNKTSRDLTPLQMPQIDTANGIFNSPRISSPAVTTPFSLGIREKKAPVAAFNNLDLSIKPTSASPPHAIPQLWRMFRCDASHQGRNADADKCEGNMKWRFKTNGRIYSSPVVDSNGIVYFSSNDGCLYAVTPEGSEKWRFVTDNSVFATPLVIEEHGIFFGSEDNHFYSVDFEGKERWRLQMNDSILSSAVTDGKGTIYVGCNDGNIYALTPQGEIKWRFTINNFIQSSPAIGPDGIIYIGSWDRSLYALNPEGRLKWSFKTGDIVESSPAVDEEGNVYFGSYDHHIYCLDSRGKLKWKYKTKDKIYSSCALFPGRGIYAGSDDNYLYHLNFNGKLKWTVRTDYRIKSSPALDGQGNIYIGSNDFSIYGINPEGEIMWKFKTNGSIESSPCITNDGALYVGSNDGWLYFFK